MKIRIKLGYWLLAVLYGLPASAEIVRYGNCAIDSELQQLPKCAVLTVAGQLFVRRDFAEDVFSKRVIGVVARPSAIPGHEFAATWIPEGGWAYFDRTGLVIVKNVATMDNGADDFYFGLVRVTKGNKWGLADLNGKLVVPMHYDGLLDFEPKTGWLACSGCRTITQGEHSWFSGGSWVRLGKHGEVLGETTDPANQSVSK